MSKLKVGVIGAGAWGKNHVRTLSTMSDVELVSVCDASAGIRDRVAKQYPGVSVTDDPAALLAAVEAVVIASPAPTHASLALQAIAAGVPSLVEKPFALNVADAERMAESADRAKVGMPARANACSVIFVPDCDRRLSGGTSITAASMSQRCASLTIHSFIQGGRCSTSFIE